jgi:hypothetical protein
MTGATVQGRRVDEGALESPGDFYWDAHNDADPTIVSIIFLCPACGAWHGTPVKPGSSNGWEWNGDKDRPTLSPSMLFSGGHIENPDCRWHGYLRDGQWITA